MFKTNPDPMRMEPTPERVFALCRLAAYQRMTREELKNALLLCASNEKANTQINLTFSVAVDELHVLQARDGYLELAVDEEILSNPTQFRRFVAHEAFQKADSTFFLFSKWIIGKNDEIFKMTNWEVMGATCASEVAELSKINENAVLGWRFWAAYLGLGYLNGTMFLPNMKIRLQDILATEFASTFQYDKAIRAADFILWLSSRMPEIDFSGKLPLALSAALRTLDELDLIHLETWRDSNRAMLFYVDGDRNDFSHITVRREIAS